MEDEGGEQKEVADGRIGMTGGREGGRSSQPIQ